MPDNLPIYEALAKAREQKKACALATVIKVYGSAYRREGAKMYIGEDEQTIGMISGGCLEADVAEIAKKVIATKKPVVKFYDMDEDLVWGLGLGCPGKVEVYIEPIE